MSDRDDRTEEPTARRLTRARDEGNVAVSREVPALVTLVVLWLMLVMAAPPLTAQLLAWLSAFTADADRIDLSDGGQGALRSAMGAAARAVLPVGLVAAGAGFAASVLQTGFLFNLSRLAPDIERVSPGRGLRRLFSMHSLVDAAKSVVKVAVVGAACWQVLAADVPQLERALYWEPPMMVDRLVRLILRLLLTMLAAQLVVAIADLFWVRYRHTRDLRMSRFEVKQETKDNEGDPIIRRRLRQIRTMRARRRMRTAVKRATVVVTNPTHYAVALSYDRDRNPAPIVVAKGVDSMAARIRDTAREFNVPVVVNPPLARALHAVELDTVIPAELYKSVAELIAYVWRLSRRQGLPAGGTRPAGRSR